MALGNLPDEANKARNAFELTVAAMANGISSTLGDTLGVQRVSSGVTQFIPPNNETIRTR